MGNISVTVESSNPSAKVERGRGYLGWRLLAIF